MHDQAGTLIWGSMVRRGPQVPRWMSERMVGRSSRQRSKTSDGSAPSRPIIATRRMQSSACLEPPAGKPGGGSIGAGFEAGQNSRPSGNHPGLWSRIASADRAGLSTREGCGACFLQFVPIQSPNPKRACGPLNPTATKMLHGFNLEYGPLPQAGADPVNPAFTPCSSGSAACGIGSKRLQRGTHAWSRTYLFSARNPADAATLVNVVCPGIFRMASS